MDVTKKTLVVHDGSTAGGTALAKASDIPTVPTVASILANAALTGTPTAPNPSVGTRSTRVATMQMFSDEFPKGTNWCKLPSGKIIQWGTVTIPGSNAALLVGFPISFPNACHGIVVTIAGSAFSNAVVGAALVNNASFNIFNASTAGNQGAFWQAIGE
ncbi:hypothetical protein GmRootV15_26910 [Variovorax sp. V15]